MAVSIAIDGPAGAGKSTIAKELAKKTGYIYVDTGAMYRAISLFVLENNVATDDENEVAKALVDMDVSIAYENDVMQVYLNGKNVSDKIRTQEVGFCASTISKYACVREKLLDLQRNIAKNNDVIMDGRDIGTCVLPNATVKIFLTASSKTRAHRRWLELTTKGEECSEDEIEKEIIARDNQDMNREIAPLKKAEDAILVDTSEMNIAQVVDELYRISMQ